VEMKVIPSRDVRLKMFNEKDKEHEWSKQEIGETIDPNFSPE